MLEDRIWNGLKSSSCVYDRLLVQVVVSKSLHVTPPWHLASVPVHGDKYSGHQRFSTKFPVAIFRRRSFSSYNSTPIRPITFVWSPPIDWNSIPDVCDDFQRFFNHFTSTFRLVSTDSVADQQRRTVASHVIDHRHISFSTGINDSPYQRRTKSSTYDQLQHLLPADLLNSVDPKEGRATKDYWIPDVSR